MQACLKKYIDWKPGMHKENEARRKYALCVAGASTIEGSESEADDAANDDDLELGVL